MRCLIFILTNVCYVKKLFQIYDYFINRFSNILPYDHNRVKLRKAVDGCDYVNASWITEGSHNKRQTYKDVSCSGISFMSSQGPTEYTTPHHLQMIYENNVDIIVMLTKLEEMKENGNFAHFK